MSLIAVPDQLVGRIVGIGIDTIAEQIAIVVPAEVHTVLGGDPIGGIVHIGIGGMLPTDGLIQAKAVAYRVIGIEIVIAG